MKKKKKFKMNRKSQICWSLFFDKIRQKETPTQEQQRNKYFYSFLLYYLSDKFSIVLFYGYHDFF